MPVANILEFITPEELQRFENQDYEDERERERIRLATLKPRGRPRKYLLPGTTTPNPLPKSLLPTPKQGYSAFREAITPGEPKRKGRPKGWRKNAIPLSSNGPVPSFDGPQPTGDDSTPLEASTRDQSVEGETPLDIQARTGVFSMVAASGLMNIDSETEVEPSREITPFHPVYEDEDIGESSSKRRRFDTYAMPAFDGLEDSSAIPPTFARKPRESNTSEEDERVALLGQFISQREQQTHTDASSDDSMLSTIKARPKVTDPRPPSARPAQTTPTRSPKRTSLTPHFPVNGWKIPSISAGKLSDSASKNRSISPTSNRKSNKASPGVSPRRLPTRRHPIAPSRPSAVAVTASDQIPTKRKAFRDITSYFAPQSTDNETISIPQTQPSASPMKRESTLDPAYADISDVEGGANKEGSYRWASEDSLASESATSFVRVAEADALNSVERVDPRLRNMPSHVSDSNESEDDEDEEESDVDMVEQTPYETHVTESDNESDSSTDSAHGTIFARAR